MTFVFSLKNNLIRQKMGWSNIVINICSLFDFLLELLKIFIYNLIMIYVFLLLLDV